jgi:nicotinamide-nucleotide amidase
VFYLLAEIISTGTELLLGQVPDSNSRYLAQQLSACGIEVVYHTTVGDDPERLAAALSQALTRADLLVMTGGLGPTQFDLTRQTISNVLGLPMEMHPELLAVIERFFRDRRLEMPENCARQAYVPRGAVVLPNRRGTAPGLLVRHGRKTIVALPGPPREMTPMFEESALGYLRAGGLARGTIVTRMLKVMGLGESLVETMLPDLLRRQGNPAVALLAREGEVLIRLTARGEDVDTAVDLIRPWEEKIRLQLGMHVYGSNDDRLEAIVGRMLRERGLTLAVAESCTGGLLGIRITDVSGSSDYFLAGLTCYSNRAKMELLGVKEETLVRFGAVSPDTALEMASGVCERCGADVGLATTGIAGPGGGTDRKPIGLVYIAVKVPGATNWRELRLPGERGTVKALTVKAALDLLRTTLLKEQGGAP